MAGVVLVAKLATHYPMILMTSVLLNFSLSSFKQSKVAVANDNGIIQNLYAADPFGNDSVYSIAPFNYSFAYIYISTLVHPSG